MSVTKKIGGSSWSNCSGCKMPMYRLGSHEWYINRCPTCLVDEEMKKYQNDSFVKVKWSKKWECVEVQFDFGMEKEQKFFCALGPYEARLLAKLLQKAAKGKR